MNVKHFLRKLASSLEYCGGVKRKDLSFGLYLLGSVAGGGFGSFLYKTVNIVLVVVGLVLCHLLVLCFRGGGLVGFCGCLWCQTDFT